MRSYEVIQKNIIPSQEEAEAIAKDLKSLAEISIESNDFIEEIENLEDQGEDTEDFKPGFREDIKEEE